MVDFCRPGHISVISVVVLLRICRGDYYGNATLRDISRESVMSTAYKKLRYTSASNLRVNFSVTFLNEPGIVRT